MNTKIRVLDVESISKIEELNHLIGLVFQPNFIDDDGTALILGKVLLHHDEYELI